MIVYNLTCDNRHAFEGWFASQTAFETQHQGGKVECPVCASTMVTRLPSASYVNTSASKQQETVHPVAAGAGLSAQVRARVLEYIRANSDDVGAEFAEQARKIFYAEAPQRNIRGVASTEQVMELREEGIEVLAIPGVAAAPDGKVH